MVEYAPRENEHGEQEYARIRLLEHFNVPRDVAVNAEGDVLLPSRA